MLHKVSIIVPNYNHAKFLRERIDSILNQTYKDFELIILDDNSTDNSREIIEEYRSNPHVTNIVYNEENSGSPFYQWHKGVSLAKGDYIWIAESDDWAKEDFLSIVMSEFSRRDKCGIAYTLAHYMKDYKEQWELKYTGVVNEWSGIDFLKKKLLYGCVIYNVSMVVFKKELFMKIQPTLYNTMRLCGDWMIYSRICSQTNVIQIDKPHSYYRMHNTNTSSNAERQGGTFLEGLKVLEYIVNTTKIKSFFYARYWGREWFKYEKRFAFSKMTNNKIKSYTIKHHIFILLWYYIYKIYKSLL